MFDDPADETYRKPRRFRNTPTEKYIRLSSLVITLCFAGAMYISWRRNVVPLLNEDKQRLSQLSEDEKAMLEDYAEIPFLRGTIDKLIERQQAKSNAEAESKNMQANE